MITRERINTDLDQVRRLRSAAHSSQLLDLKEAANWIYRMADAIEIKAIIDLTILDPK